MHENLVQPVLLVTSSKQMGQSRAFPSSASSHSSTGSGLVRRRTGRLSAVSTPSVVLVSVHACQEVVHA